MTALLLTHVNFRPFFYWTVHSEILDFDNPDCIVDDTLPPDEEGNYVDCNTPESLAENRTKCCDIEGNKGCCENKTEYVFSNHNIYVLLLYYKK